MAEKIGNLFKRKVAFMLGVVDSAKKNFLYISMLWSFHTQAADNLTLNITGNLQVAAKCDFDLTTTTANLGRVSSSVFGGIGSASEWVSLNIRSEGCNPATTRLLWTYIGIPDEDNPELFKITSGAQGVAINVEWLNEGGAIGIVKPNGTEDWNKRADGDYYHHRVRYVKTREEITGGSADLIIVVSINYV